MRKKQIDWSGTLQTTVPRTIKMIIFFKQTIWPKNSLAAGLPYFLMCLGVSSLQPESRALIKCFWFQLGWSFNQPAIVDGILYTMFCFKIGYHLYVDLWNNGSPQLGCKYSPITDIIVRTDANLKSRKTVRLYQFEQCVFIEWQRKG